MASKFKLGDRVAFNSGYGFAKDEKAVITKISKSRVRPGTNNYTILMIAGKKKGQTDVAIAKFMKRAK